MSFRHYPGSIATLIASGDVSAAEDRYRADGWSAAETASGIRSACSVWGIDPGRFGAPLPPPAGPETWALRATLTLDPIPRYPTSRGDFDDAAGEAANHRESGAHLWRCEAIRWRLGHAWPEPLDVEAITAAAVELRAMFRRRRGEEG